MKLEKFKIQDDGMKKVTGGNPDNPIHVLRDRWSGLWF